MHSNSMLTQVLYFMCFFHKYSTISDKDSLLYGTVTGQQDHHKENMQLGRKNTLDLKEKFDENFVNKNNNHSFNQ